MMKKSALDLTFAELTEAGESAARDAIAASHAAGLSSWGSDGNGQLVETLPNGDVVHHASTSTPQSSGKARTAPKARGSFAA
jgi:hypothetical protein